MEQSHKLVARVRARRAAVGIVRMLVEEQLTVLAGIVLCFYSSFNRYLKTYFIFVAKGREGQPPSTFPEWLAIRGFLLFHSLSYLKRLKQILEKSTYIPTSHNLSHPRNDGRNLWFSYHDADGRGVYFKVNWNCKY